MGCVSMNEFPRTLYVMCSDCVCYDCLHTVCFTVYTVHTVFNSCTMNGGKCECTCVDRIWGN